MGRYERPAGWLRAAQRSVVAVNEANRLGVESDSLSDVEVGCTVWSKTVRDAADNPAGGVVVSTFINDDGSFEFGVLRWRGNGGEPYVHVFDGDDIDMPVTQWYGRTARDAAAKVHKWLGEKAQKKLDHVDRVRWSGIAASLDVAGLTGQYLVRAESRYKARFNKRAAS